MLPVFKIVQIVLRPARHNSIFTVSACLWILFSLAHFDPAFVESFSKIGILLCFAFFDTSYISRLSIVKRHHSGTVVLVHFLQSACEQVSGAPEHVQVNVRDDIWLICNLCCILCTPCSFSVFSHWCITHSIEGVWNASATTFVAFFRFKKRIQTVTQSISGGWEHRYRGYKVMDRVVC